MGAGEDILKQLAKQEIMLARLCAHLGIDRAPASGGHSNSGSAPSGAAGKTGEVATLAAIQGDRGDVKIRMNPRDWIGEQFKGRVASQCPPDFLDIYADQMDYFASKNPDPKKAGWDILDGARCRRWAVEMRAGRVKPAAQNEALPPAPGDDSGGNQWDSGGDLPPPPAFDDSVPF